MEVILTSMLNKKSLKQMKFFYLFITMAGYVILFGCKSGDTNPKGEFRVYVSMEGNDEWSGKLAQPNMEKTDGPFRTLEAARNAISMMKDKKQFPKGNVIINILEGVYELQNTFELDSVHSGMNVCSRIKYSGEKNREVRLRGGRDLVNWNLISDSNVFERINPDIRDKIYQTELSPLGINNFGSASRGGVELFFNDKPMWLSRYPNKGFVRITGLLNENPVDIRGTKGDKTGKFNYDDSRISRWVGEKDGYVHGYWFWDWCEQRHQIAGINPGRKILEVVPPYHGYGYRLGQWFYGFNLLCEIDEPGEYYIDREKGILYFYPPSDIKEGHAYISLNENLISMNNVSFLTIEGIILEGCRETAVKMEDCSNNSIVACTIRNTGDWAVSINGGKSNSITDCDIYGIGAGGISIWAGDRKTLMSGECVAENNYIHHVARIKRVYNPGITINGVGNIARHNVIAHLPHMGIGFSGNDHLMEYNEIYDVCYESNDAGALYTGRSWTMRGNIIRYNYFHDISGFEGKGCSGVYLDDAFSSVDVTGNVFDNVTRAVQIGGGRYNKVINNIFIDCVPSLSIDARGLGWMASTPEEWINEAIKKGTISGIAFNQPPYSLKYPELIKLIDDEPAAPKGNVISCNICSGGYWDKSAGNWDWTIEEKVLQYLEMENNVLAPGSAIKDSLSQSIVIANPMFANQDDPADGKYQLNADSPTLKLGFKQIPFDKIGLYQSKNRLSWPFLYK